MADQDYWFARRFPVGHPRNAMGPVNEQGWSVVRRFIAWMVGGAVAAVVVALIGIFWVPFLWVLAPIIFIGAAIYAGFAFISAAQGRGDPNHTVEDYRAGRVK